VEVNQPIRKQLKTAEILDVYASPSDRLVVVDKTSGRKADANAGICAAATLLSLLHGHDIILEEDALTAVARPWSSRAR